MIREESINIPFQFAAGKAGSAFLIALRDRQQIIGSHCQDCARTLAPARPYCPECGGENLQGVDIGPGAHLVSWTDVPEYGVFALLRPDGADTAMVHKLLGSPTDLQPGIRLRAVFASQRQGHISDIAGFEIVSEGAP